MLYMVHLRVISVSTIKMNEIFLTKTKYLIRTYSS